MTTSISEKLKQEADELVAIADAMDALRMRVRVKHALRIREARTDPAKFAEYVLKDEATGRPIKNAPHHKEWHRHWNDNEYSLMIAPVGHGKCTVAGTPHLLANGSWIEIQDQKNTALLLQIDPETAHHREVRSSRVINNGLKEVVKINLSNGSEGLYTLNHKLMTIHGWREAGELEVGDYIAAARLVPEPSNPLYMSLNEARILGSIVADGAMTQELPTYTKFDTHEREWMIEACIDVGLKVKSNYGGDVNRIGLPGSQEFFRTHGLHLCSSHTKRIPIDIFKSSNEIVCEFLASYMEGDVHINGTSNQVEFSTVSHGLVHDLRRLLLRIGCVGRVSKRKTMCDGKEHESYRLLISGGSIQALSSLPIRGRKGDQLKVLIERESGPRGIDVVPKEWADYAAHKWVDHRNKNGHHRSVVRQLAKNPREIEFCASDNVHWVKIESIERMTAQTYGIEVYDPNHAYISDGLVSHNTQCSIARVLFILGKNPQRRVALISDTERQASKILRQIRGYIESSKELHELFPNLIPSKRSGDPWTNLELIVNRPTISKDPSIQALGVGGPINGSRVDDMVLDDVVSFESSRTPTQREKIRDWFDTTVITRLDLNETISIIGTPWHYEDLLHELEKRPGFFSRRYSSVLNPEAAPEDWEVLWSAKWNKNLLLKRRDNMTAAAFSKKYLCQVVSRETARFKEEWIQQAIKAGSVHKMIERAPTNPDGSILSCFTGVDLGIGQKDASAASAIFTIALLRNGKRVVCEIQSGHWTAHEIIQRLQSVYERFNSTIFVEDNGAQRFLVQMCDGHVPVSSWTTTAGRKFHEQYGVESLAAEMARGWWVIPSDDGVVTPEVANWLDECRNYDPEQHTGDRLMASWIARESLRAGSGDRTLFLDLQAR